jgi:hypothetical protein
MPKIKVIFGQAAKAYECFGIRYAQKYLKEGGHGKIIQRSFETEAELQAYIDALIDYDGWGRYGLVSTKRFE